MEQQAAAPAPETDNYDGWAVAYTESQGMAKLGYMGKLEDATEAGGIVLTDAFEFMLIVAPNPAGGISATSHGTPLDFTASIDTVGVWPIALVRLDGVRGPSLALYRNAHKEATELRGQLTTGPAPQIATPKTPGLVGPDNRPIR